MTTLPSWAAGISLRLVGAIVGVLLLVVGVSLVVRSCDRAKSRDAQTKVERSQAGAASNSAADAINTVSTVGGNEAASEALGRANDRDIRNAPGAGQRVDMGVHSAGLKALCKRAAYRDNPKCVGGK